MIKHLPLRTTYSNTLYKILDSAFQVFNEQGFIDTTMDDIANKAGLSRGGVRRYFETKLSLLNTLSLKVLNTIDELIEAITTDTKLSCEQQLINLVDISSSYQEYFILLIQSKSISLKNKELSAFSEQFNNSRNQLFNFLKEIITKEQQVNKHLKHYNNEDIAILFFSYFESIYLCKLPSQAHPAKDTIKNNIHLFLTDD